MILLIKHKFTIVMHRLFANGTDDIIFCNLVLTNDTYMPLFETHMYISHFYSNIPLEKLLCTMQGSRYSCGRGGRSPHIGVFQTRTHCGLPPLISNSPIKGLILMILLKLLSRFSLLLKIIVKYKMQTSIQGFCKEVMLNTITRQW